MSVGSASLGSAARRIMIFPSLSLTLALASLMAVAGIAVLATPLPHVSKLALLALIAVSGSRALWRDGLLRARKAVIGLELEGEAAVRLELADGSHALGRVLPGTTCWPWLIVLRFRIDGRRRTDACILLPDSLRRESWRQLALWLRWDASV